MYLVINGTRHTVSRRIVSRNRDTIKYLSVSPEPAELTGTIQMYHNNGDLLSEDVCENYSRRFVTGALVTLTNQPKPEPEPEEVSVWDELDAAYTEGVNTAYDQ